MSYTTKGGRLYRDGVEIVLRGVSHHGFGAPILRPQYLWQMGWKEQIADIRGLGFNAVRVPIVPDTLHKESGSNPDGTPSYLHPALNADLVGLTPLQTLDLWMAESDRQGLYILLDFHSVSARDQYFHPFVTDPEHYGAGKWVETWNGRPYTADDWRADLALVAGRYAGLPHFMGVDVFNEPRDRVRWRATGDLHSWARLAESAAAAILAAHPDLLIFVQGLGNANFDGRERTGIAINWGENFQPQAYDQLAIAADKLVLSPHTYGPDVFVKSTFGAPDFPANLAADWETLFGQFHGAHAVVIGEWGGRYTHGSTDAVWQDALVDYLVAKGMRSSFYWCYTPNSGDTGGILDDELKPRQDKMDLLRRLWAATPPATEPHVPEPTIPEPPAPTDKTDQIIALLTQIELNTRLAPEFGGPR